MGTSRTDSNYQVDICSGNICPGDICPNQEYLSCYWLNFNQTLKVGSFFKGRNFYGDNCPGNRGPGVICPYQQYLSCYWPDFDKTFWTQFLGALIFVTHMLFGQTCLDPIFLDSLDTNFFWTNETFFDLNPFLPDFFWN